MEQVLKHGVDANAHCKAWTSVFDINAGEAGSTMMQPSHFQFVRTWVYAFVSHI